MRHVHRAGLSRVAMVVLAALVDVADWNPDPERTAANGTETWCTETLAEDDRPSVAQLAELAGLDIPTPARSRGKGRAGYGRRAYEGLRQLEAAGLIKRHGTGPPPPRLADGKYGPDSRDRERLGKKNDYEVFPAKIRAMATARQATLGRFLDARTARNTGSTGKIGDPAREVPRAVPRHAGGTRFDPAMPAWSRFVELPPHRTTAELVALVEAVGRVWYQREDLTEGQAAALCNPTRVLWEEAHAWGDPDDLAHDIVSVIEASRRCQGEAFLFGVRGTKKNPNTGKTWRPKGGNDWSDRYYFVVGRKHWGTRLALAELHAIGDGSCGCPAHQDPHATGPLHATGFPPLDDDDETGPDSREDLATDDETSDDEPAPLPTRQPSAAVELAALVTLVDGRDMSPADSALSLVRLRARHDEPSRALGRLIDGRQSGRAHYHVTAEDLDAVRELAHVWPAISPGVALVVVVDPDVEPPEPNA